MIFPRQILYKNDLLKFYFLNRFTDLKNQKNKITKNLKLDRNKKIIFTSKGRTALYIILKYLFKTTKKKQVIMSPFTIFDLVNIVIAAGTKPLFIDHKKNSFEMDYDKIKNIIKKNKNILAIICTHYCLNSENFLKLKSLCKNKNIKIIQDCAIAASSQYKNKSLANFSDYSFFSFNLFKFIPALTGGAIVSSDKKMMHFANKEQKNFKQFSFFDLIFIQLKSNIIKILTSKFIYSFVIFHIFRFGELYNLKWIIKFTKNDPYPFLRKKLFDFEKKKLNQNQLLTIEKNFLDTQKLRNIREKNYKYLMKLIKSNKVKLFKPNKLSTHSYINFPLLVNNKKEFRNYLFKNNYDSSKYFYRNCNELKIFKKYKQDCKNIEVFVKQLIFLPIHHRVSKNYLKNLAFLINKY